MYDNWAEEFYGYQNKSTTDEVHRVLSDGFLVIDLCVTELRALVLFPNPDNQMPPKYRF